MWISLGGHLRPLLYYGVGNNLRLASCHTSYVLCLAVKIRHGLTLLVCYLFQNVLDVGYYYGPGNLLDAFTCVALLILTLILKSKCYNTYL